MTPCLCLKLCENQMKSFYILCFALLYSSYILFICFHSIFLKGSGRETTDYNKKSLATKTPKEPCNNKEATHIKLATKTTIDNDRLDWNLNSHRLPTILNRYTLYNYLNDYTTGRSTSTIPPSTDYHVTTTSPEKQSCQVDIPDIIPHQSNHCHAGLDTAIHRKQSSYHTNGFTCAAYWCGPTLD